MDFNFRLYVFIVQINETVISRIKAYLHLLTYFDLLF